MALMTVSIERSRMRDSSPSRSIDDMRSAGAGTRVLLGLSGSIGRGSAYGRPGSPFEAGQGRRWGKVARGCTGTEASCMIGRNSLAPPRCCNPVSLLQRCDRCVRVRPGSLLPSHPLHLVCKEPGADMKMSPLRAAALALASFISSAAAQGPGTVELGIFGQASYFDQSLQMEQGSGGPGIRVGIFALPSINL